MRCVSIDRFGKPADVLTLGERDLPVPAAGQVRLKTVLSPIHNHDLAIIRGVYGYKLPLPAVPGTEALGIVDALGDGVSHLKLGQRVAVAAAQGVWAEYFATPAINAVPVPDALSDEIACQLLAMPLSALMLLDALEIAPGQWMIQNAANGAVGRVLDAIARARGVHVVNLVRKQAQADELRAGGAAYALATENDDWKTALPALTGNAPIVRAVDSVSGHAANDLVSVLALGGMLMSFGALSGEPLTVDPGALIFKQATIKGFWAAKPSGSAEDRERMVRELITLALRGALPLEMAGCYSFDQARAAATAAEVPGRHGKVLLKP